MSGPPCHWVYEREALAETKALCVAHDARGSAVQHLFQEPRAGVWGVAGQASVLVRCAILEIEPYLSVSCLVISPFSGLCTS